MSVIRSRARVRRPNGQAVPPDASSRTPRGGRRSTHVVGILIAAVLTLSALGLTGCSTAGGTHAGACRLRPSADNTGASGTLRDDPTTVIDRDGTTLEDAKVSSLEISARGVTVRNVEVDGAIFITGDDATLDHVTTTGIAISSASGATVEYADVSHSPQDGIHITSDRGRLVQDVVLRYNFVHSPEVPPDAHYDGTQVRGVDQLLVECSVYDAGPYEGTYNAAVYLENANGGDSHVSIINNWLLGSGFSVMLDAVGTVIVGNQLGGDVHWGSCYLGVGTSPESLVMHGNTDVATGRTDPMCTDGSSPSSGG